MAKSKITFTKNPNLGFSGNLADNIKEDLETNFIGTKSRALLDKENTVLVISKNTLIGNSKLLQEFATEEPRLFNKMYRVLHNTIDKGVKQTFPLKGLPKENGNYKLVGKDYILVIAYGDRNNFAQVRALTNSALEITYSRFESKLTERYRDLFYRFSENRLFITKDAALSKINAYYKSSKDVFKPALVAAGFPAGGITKEHLSSKFLNTTAKNNSSIRKYDVLFSALSDLGAIDRVFKKVLPAVELGHLGGPEGRFGTSSAPSSPGELRAAIGTSYLDAIGANKRHKDKIKKAIIELHKIENHGIGVEIDKSFSESLAKINAVVIVPQHYIDNNIQAIKETNIFSRFVAPLVSLAKGRKFNILTGKGSPSILEFIELTILSAITGKSVRSFREKSKNKNINRKKSKISSKNAFTKKIKLNLKTPNIRPPKQVQQLDVFALQGLINAMLAEQVEQQMADSSSSDGRLRYQTGRFAESANLLTLTRNQAGILAGVYSYQRDPYDVFLPGHKMATPKRDPRIYVEGAIREAALIALKGKMPGIALELK